MTEPKMIQIIVDDVMINLAHWKGNGKPILAVHGITANCMCWDILANNLTPGFDFLAMDLRGRGRSDKPASGYSADHHVNDIVGILDELRIEKVNLMGHSLGAFITLAFAAKHPDRIDRIVLVDGGGDLSPEQFDNVFQGIKPALDRLTMTFPSADAYLEKMKSAPYMKPWNSVIENYYNYEIQVIAEGVKTNIAVDHIAEESGNVRKVDCRRYYSQISCNTLVLRADQGLLSQDDILLPVDVIDRMMAEIPNVKRYDVEGVNHYGIVFQPHPGRDKALKEFLKN